MEGDKSHSSVVRSKEEAIPEEESGDVVSHNRHPSKSYGHIPI